VAGADELMRATFLQSNFNAGEWSPQLYGRVDLPKRKSALSHCLNYVPLLQGPLTRRPGTEYIANVASNDVSVRLQRFEFNVTQAYVLEFTNNRIRFYTEGGQLLSGGAPYTVATTYAASELSTVQFTQSDDVLYIVHPNHPPATLSRLGATNWVLADIVFVDGPYLPRNVGANKVSASTSVIGASATITAVTTDGINNGAGFLAQDVGRLMRIRNESSTAATLWSIFQITGVTNTLTCTATVLGLNP
jgi:hypothetical protein